MKKKFITLTIVFCFSAMMSQEQFENFETYTQTTFTSPEVSSFERVSLIPNDLSTGRLDLNIPIYTVKIGRLEYPIYLAYNSGGIKVDEVASEVGLGWSISKSYISRKIVDANDFDNVGTQYHDPVGGGFGGTLSDPEFHAHWEAQFYGQNRIGFFLNQVMDFKPDFHLKSIDAMPDLYSLSVTNGFKTEFYFNDINTPVELNENSSVIVGTKIKSFFNNPSYVESSTFIDFPMYDFGKIEVVSNEGIKYTFEDYDVAMTNIFSIPGSIYAEYFQVPKVSSWHISEIEDLLTGDKIEFEYESYNADPVTAPFDVWTYAGPDALLRFKSFKSVPKGPFLNNTFQPADLTCHPSPVTLGGMGIINYSPNKYGHYHYTHTRYFQKNRLLRIKFSGGQVNFNWGADRLDDFNSKELASIDILSQEDNSTIPNKIIKTFNFTYDYFDTGCSNNYKCKRLRLKEFKEIGKPSYLFSYYNENDYFPPITSHKKDYLGYYNGSIPAPTSGSIYTPSLYFYPGKSEYSILPYDIPTETNYDIPGGYSDSSPSLAEVRTWSLFSIRYPTGAITEIDYSLHDLNIFNHTLLATGLRLNELTIKDENNTVRKINYNYVASNGESSGSFVNPPNFGRTTLWFSTSPFSEANLSLWDTNQIYDTFIINQYPSIDADVGKGNFISYSRVLEEEIGNGYTEYNFTSPESHPNQYIRNEDTQEPLTEFTGSDFCNANQPINNSAWGIEYFSDYSFQRGKLLSKKVFNNDGVKLEEAINNYSDNETVSVETFKKRLFRRNTNTPSDDDDYGNSMDVAKNYTKNTFKLINTNQISYYNGSSVESNVKEFEYNDIGLVVSEKMGTNSGDSFKEPNILGEYRLNNNGYINDISSIDTGFIHLQNINFLSFPIYNVKYFRTEFTDYPYESELINVVEKTLKSNGFIDKIIVGSKEDTYKDEIIFDSYNSRGKPTQFTDKIGKVTSLFWYNDLLICKIENASYLSIKNYIQSNYGFNTDNCKSNNCQPYFSQSLRDAFPDARIYNYSYESTLENPISVTDPNNKTIYFEYDDLQRLIRVIDENGNILNENEYIFKLPN